MSKKLKMKKVEAMALQALPFLFILGLVVGGFFGGAALGLWDNPFAITPPTTTPTTLDSDEIEFDVYWWGTADAIDIDDFDIDVYRYTIEGKTLTQISNRGYADYSSYTSIDAGYTLTLDEDLYKYYFNFTGTDICIKLVALEDLSVGYVNTIYLLNQTEDTSMLAYSTDELSVTVVNSTYDKWTITTKCLDAAEGSGEITADEGWIYPFYPSGETIFAGLEEYIVLIIDSNETATSAAWCSYIGPDASTVTEVCSGAYIYYLVPRILIGEQTFLIQFNSDYLGSTFDLDDISIAYGTADSNTVWDVQA